MLDKVKIGLSAIVLLAGIIGYYQLPSLMGADVSVLLRVAVALVALVLAIILFVLSSYGKSLIEFAKGARIELRKMVWPTRPETMQTTGIVLVMVILVGLFLWGIDALVFNAIYDWLLGLDS